MYVKLIEYPNYLIKHTPPTLCRIKGDQIIECSQTTNSSKDAYWVVSIVNKEGKRVKRSMHRLLMETFVPNPHNKSQVNHIDGNKSNNALSNLEWVTAKENSIHAYSTGLSSNSWKQKEVHQYSLSGEFLNSYGSDDAAQAATGVAKQNISKVTLGLRDHAGYFLWSRECMQAIQPATKKYIKGYQYNGTFYNTLGEIGTVLGKTNIERIGIRRFNKSIRNSITIIYYT